MPRALATALLVFSIVPGALAERRLAVVELATPPSMVALGAQVTRTVLRVAAEQKYKVIAPDEIRARLGEARFRELQECAERVACISAKLRGIAVDRAVLGSLNRDDKSYLLRLWLVDLASLKVTSEVDKAILIAARRLPRDVEAVVPGFLRGEQESLGTLKLSANVKGAQVGLDGKPIGLAPISTRLKPGKYQVRVEKEPYLPVERLVTVEAGAIADETFRLVRPPGAAPEAEPAPAVARQEPRTVSTVSSRSGFQVPTLAWIAAGVGAAAAGTAVGFGIAARNLDNNLSQGYDPATNSYSGTRSDAQSGKRDALIANVLFGVAGAALATGVVLTIIDNQRESAGAALVPAPGGGRILVEGRF